jgi:hypothetical protein
MRCRNLTFGLALLASCLGALAADITPQPGGSSSMPRAPSLIAPMGVHEEPLENRWLRFEWRQLASPNFAPPADYFVICVFDPTERDCYNARLHWWRAATELDRVPIQSGSLLGPSQLIGHAYTYPFQGIGFPLDRQLQWSVGACTRVALTSCTFAPPANLWISTLDVRASSIVSTTVDGYLQLDGVATNDGFYAEFANELWIWQAVPNSSGLGCENDVNLHWAEYALTRSGAILHVPSLPRHPDGAVDVGREVVEAVLSREWFEHPVHLHRADAKLVSGYQRVVVRNYNTLYLPDRPLEGPAYTFVALLNVDAHDDLLEFDESDNRLAVCQVVVYPILQ